MKSSAIIVLISFFWMGTSWSEDTAEQAPNVLFICIDDLRPELGCYGQAEVISPHIDQLASEGMLFERAYCQVPVCGASRASLMTGMLPTKRRFVDYRARVDVDAPHAVTLPETFRKAGYTTIANGKVFHNALDTAERSWDELGELVRPVEEEAESANPAEWLLAYPGKRVPHTLSYDPSTTEQLTEKWNQGRIFEAPDVADDAYVDGQVAQTTINDLKRLSAAKEPFFLACGFMRPHLPFYAPKRYWDLYQRDAITIAGNQYRPKGAPKELKRSGEISVYHPGEYTVNSEAWHRMMRHGYRACVSYVDQLTGDILAALESEGLADNTIVVIWGDHGWHLGEHNFWSKHNTMHLATRVPLIVKVPGELAGRTASLVETSDIFPTLCELAGIEIPNTVQGRSFRALLEDPKKPFRKIAYSRFKQGDAVITERFSYTSYNGGKSKMLYDLEKDPDENQNVADHPEYAAVVQNMHKFLKRRVKEATRTSGATTASSTNESPLPALVD